MKLALALSGGGFRATVFHLGVIARLAEEHRLEDVNMLSTVSGGSLCIGLLYALNDFHWPSSSDFLAKTLPRARQLLTTKDLQRAVILRQLSTFWNIYETRADDLSAMLQKQWGMVAKLCELPTYPRWIINATCYETGKNWRFDAYRMGDYVFGYCDKPEIPLADAVAASAGFPGLIGPLVLDTRSFQWFNFAEAPQQAGLDIPPDRIRQPVRPLYPQVHLWDGGVYDNYGLEGLLDVQGGWRKGVEFLIVSDAAGRSGPESYRRGAKGMLRLMTGIMMDQVRSLRARIVLSRIMNFPDRDKGIFLQIGNAAADVLQHKPELATLAAGCLDEGEAQRAAAMPTVIRQLSGNEFDLLFRHGFEVADCTLPAYYPADFRPFSFAMRSGQAT